MFFHTGWNLWFWQAFFADYNPLLKIRYEPTSIIIGRGRVTVQRNSHGSLSYILLGGRASQLDPVVRISPIYLYPFMSDLEGEQPQPYSLGDENDHHGY